ncbi:MAG: hypothetical protein ACXWUP_07625 [Allosphingosinicella sp.]
METRAWVVLALVLLIALVLGAAMRHATRDQGGFGSPPPRRSRRARTGTGQGSADRASQVADTAEATAPSDH